MEGGPRSQFGHLAYTKLDCIPYIGMNETIIKVFGARYMGGFSDSLNPLSAIKHGFMPVFLQGWMRGNRLLSLES